MPAEDTLTYKIEIDPSDLGAQLDQIRSQVNLAMGAAAFSQAPAPPGLDMSFSALPSYVESTAGSFAGTTQQLAGSSEANLSTYLNHNYNAFKLGYSKFTTGMERMGLMVPPAPMISFPQQGVTDFTRQMEAIQAIGQPGGRLFTATGLENVEMPGLVKGALGFGYDPNQMAFSRSEFNQRYGDALGTRVTGMLERNTGMLAGAAIGSVVPGVGTFAGSIVGMGYDMTMGWAGQQRQQEEQVGGALQAISKGTLMPGTLTQSEGIRMAENLLGVADSYESRINKLTRDDIQTELLEFTKAGGFDATRSVDEFEAVAKGVIANTRKVMQSLRMTQEEAIKMMAEMQREGLVSTGDASMFALDISQSAKASGMDPMELMNFMRQGAEMYRGSGVGMQGGMQMLQEARLTVQDMIQDTGTGLTIARELGGTSSAAAALAQGQTNFMQTAMGLVQYNNMQQGGMTTDMIGAMGNMSGMNAFDVYRMRYNIDQDMGSGKMSPQEMASFQIDPYLDRYASTLRMTEGRGMESDDYEGFMYWMEQSTGMPLAEVRQLFNVRFADPTQAADRDTTAAQGALKQLSQEGYQGTKWDQAVANAGMALDELMAPLRKWERGAHEWWSPYSKDISQWWTDTEQMDLVTDGALTNNTQRMAAAAYAAGVLNEDQQSILDEATTAWEQEAQSAEPGFFANRANYKEYNIETGGNTFQQRVQRLHKRLGDSGDSGVAAQVQLAQTREMPEADLDIHGLQPVDPALYAEREEILERIEDVDPADISDADNLEISQNLLKINIAEANREFAVSGAGRLMDAPTLSKTLQSEFILDGEGQLLPAYTQSLDMGSYGGSTAATVVAGQEEWNPRDPKYNWYAHNPNTGEYEPADSFDATIPLIEDGDTFSGPITPMAASETTDPWDTSGSVYRDAITRDYLQTTAALFTRGDQGDEKFDVLTKFITELSGEDLASGLTSLGFAAVTNAEAMAQNGGLFREEKAMDAYNALVFSTKSTHESTLRNAKQKNEGVLWDSVQSTLQSSLITLSQDGDLGRMEALNAAVSSLTAHGAIQTDYVAPPDPASIESIEAFQAASGIIVDGQIGPDTQAAIDIAETQGGPTFANVSGNDMQLVAATLNAALPGAVLNAAAGPGGEWWEETMAGGEEALGTLSGKLRTGALLPDLSLDTIARFGEDDIALKSYIAQMEEKHEQYLQYDPISALSADRTAGLHVANDEYWGESILTGYGTFSTSRLEYALEDLQQTHSWLFPDETLAVEDLSDKEQEDLLGSILKDAMGEGGTNEVLEVMQAKRTALHNSAEDSDQNQVEGMKYVIETSRMMVDALTKEGTIQGVSVQTIDNLNMAKGMLNAKVKGLEEQQTYNKIRTGEATFADIKKYKNILIEQREERGAAVFRGQQIQDMINKYSAGVDDEELGAMEEKYGRMFGPTSTAMEALSTEKLIDEKLDANLDKHGKGDRLADESIETLYLKKIADGISILITMEGNRE